MKERKREAITRRKGGTMSIVNGSNGKVNGTDGKDIPRRDTLPSRLTTFFPITLLSSSEGPMEDTRSLNFT